MGSTVLLASSERQARFERATALPMLVLSVLFVPILVIPMIVQMPESTAETFEVLEWGIWALFAGELSINVYLTEHRLRYLRAHWFDVAIVVLPFLRPFRLARLARGARLLAVASRFLHSVRAVLRERGLQYVLLAGLGLVISAAAGATYFERAADGPITDFQAALWWAATTVTTVGYGDTYPVTPEGRGLAVFLMILGISLFGAMTASVTSYIVRGSEPESASNDEILAAIRRLEERLDAGRASSD